MVQHRAMSPIGERGSSRGDAGKPGVAWRAHCLDATIGTRFVQKGDSPALDPSADFNQRTGNAVSEEKVRRGRARRCKKVGLVRAACTRGARRLDSLVMVQWPGITWRRVRQRSRGGDSDWGEDLMSGTDLVVRKVARGVDTRGQQKRERERWPADCGLGMAVKEEKADM
jgi:hypothetical protein